MAGKNKSHAAGANQFLSSEVVIGGGQLICNSSFADWWKNHFGGRTDKVTACLKKSKSWTGVTKIGGVWWSTSWDMTDLETGLSTRSPDMNPSARIPLIASNLSSRG